MLYRFTWQSRCHKHLRPWNEFSIHDGRSTYCFPTCQITSSIFTCLIWSCLHYIQCGLLLCRRNGFVPIIIFKRSQTSKLIYCYRFGSHCIYEILDWDYPDKAVIVTFSAVFFLVFIHCLTFCIYLLRRYLSNSCVGNKDSNYELNQRQTKISTISVWFLLNKYT